MRRRSLFARPTECACATRCWKKGFRDAHSSISRRDHSALFGRGVGVELNPGAMGQSKWPPIPLVCLPSWTHSREGTRTMRRWSQLTARPRRQTFGARNAAASRSHPVERLPKSRFRRAIQNPPASAAAVGIDLKFFLSSRRRQALLKRRLLLQTSSDDRVEPNTGSGLSPSGGRVFNIGHRVFFCARRPL